MASAAAANAQTISTTEVTIFDPAVSGQCRGIYIKCYSTSVGGVLIRSSNYRTTEFVELEPGDVFVLRSGSGLGVVTAKRSGGSDATITWAVNEF